MEKVSTSKQRGWKEAIQQPLEEISMQFDNSFKILTFYYTSQNNPTPTNPTQYHYCVSNSSNRAIWLCLLWWFVSCLWVHCHKEANDDYGNDHERMKEHVWNLLMFAIFTQNNVSSFAIVVPQLTAIVISKLRWGFMVHGIWVQPIGGWHRNGSMPIENPICIDHEL